jgi:anti-sigma B factor antagonist
MERAGSGDRPVLSMVGDIDIASEQDWRRRGSDWLDAHPDLVDVTLDMAGVSFLDSRGMSVLVDLHTKALARGGKLTLLAVPRRVAKAISVAGLDQVFQIEAL